VHVEAGTHGATGTRQARGASGWRLCSCGRRVQPQLPAPCLHLYKQACDVQGVSRQLVSECMGCPLLLTLAVSAIRQSADLPPGASVMAEECRGSWNSVLSDFQRLTEEAQARGAAGNYAWMVNIVYAASISSARASCKPASPGRHRRRTVPGATAPAIDLLLQVFRLLPAGRWVPQAAVRFLWQALAGPTLHADQRIAIASLKLLADYNIVMSMTKSVYKRNGANSPRGCEPGPRTSSSDWVSSRC
jgi:hypothetical protein